MITIFNRREVLITMEMAKLTKTQEILERHGIPYTIKTTNLQNSSFMGSSRARNGSFGINQDFSYEYIVFTHKTDYEKACQLI